MRVRYRSVQSLLLMPVLVGLIYLVCQVHCALPH